MLHSTAIKWFLNVCIALSALFALLFLGGTNCYLMFTVVIFSFNEVYASLSMKCKPGWIPWLFKSSVQGLKALIISLSLMFFIAVVGLKSAAYKYLASYGFEFCARMFFTTFSDCCGPRGTSHVPVFLFLFPLIFSSPLFWMEISYLSSVMVHQSSHKTPNDINRAVCILGKMWIYLASLLRPGS